MIEVSVSPGDVVAGRASALAITFANTGPGPCYDVVFRLRLPAGMVLRSGADRVDIPLVPAGGAHTHRVTLEARRPGRYELTSTNFSYRDAADRPVRVEDFRRDVLARPAAEPVPEPAGRLRVECEDDELELGAWDVLRIRVTNDTGVPLEDVTVALDGPLGGGPRSRIATLKAGQAARFPFSVHPTEGGRVVPVAVHTTYGHRDVEGRLRPREQRDSVGVAVRAPHPDAPAAPEPRPEPPEWTVLYLTASPQDQPQLRTNVEMRKVQERLQLARHRERYRLELRAAARFDDLGQALVDYEPQVVHFAGHGDRDGNLYVEDDIGRSDLVGPDGLADLFGLHAATIRCVVLNACYSERLARTTARQIEHVIGMQYPIGDEAAIQFSVGFYTGLFAGGTVPDSFARGCAYVRRRPGLGNEYQTPVLFTA